MSTMNVLFFSLIKINSIEDRGIYPDLLRQFVKQGHKVYILSAVENKHESQTPVDEANVSIIPVQIGKMQKTNVIRKGINTVLINGRIKRAVKKHFMGREIDIFLYVTPPMTISKVISYIKKHYNAKSYLMLKDIYPQGIVDLGIIKTNGIVYKYFKHNEKKLYAVSDRIGCMSPANVEYLLKHNPEIPPEKVEICPNSIEVRDLSLTYDEKVRMRKKYGLPIDKKIFVYGGNLGKPQGVPFIIECLKSQMNNPNVYFLIVGSGTEYGKLEDFFEQFKPTNMKLMKSLPKDDYDRMIAACDVGMIFLDHRFTIPNFPSRLLSYMQAKLPVLACTDPNTDIGKIIVDGGFGWWCESDDLNAFEDVIGKIVDGISPNLGEVAFEYLASNYNVQHVAQVILN